MNPSVRRFNVTMRSEDTFEIEAPDEATLRALLEQRAQYAQDRWLAARFDSHPDESDPRIVWVDHLEAGVEHAIVDVTTVTCTFCGDSVPLATAIAHDGGWVGKDCCWDERLRTTQ